MGEYASHLGVFIEPARHVRAHHRAHRHERNTHGARPVAQADGHVAPFLETRQFFFGEMAHYARDAPHDSLTEPTRENVITDAGGEDEVALGGDDAPRKGKIFLPRADQRPNHRERCSRSRRAAQADVLAIAHEVASLLERHHLVSQAAIPPLGLFPERKIILRHVFLHHAEGEDFPCSQRPEILILASENTDFPLV